MAKTKAEKIAAIELQMTQLENQRKKLIQEQKQQERKDRTTWGYLKVCCPKAYR